MLDAVGELRGRGAARRQHFGEDLEHLTVGPVADGVDGDSTAVAVASLDDVDHLGGRGKDQAGIARLAVVGFQHPGGAGAQ